MRASRGFEHVRIPLAYGVIAACTVMYVRVAVSSTGILSNTALKLALALALGRAQFRRLAGAGLAAMALAIVATLVWHGYQVPS